MGALKFLLILAILAVMAYPLLPLSKKLKKISTFRGLRYDNPHNRKNFVFVLLSALEFLVLALLFKTFTQLGIKISQIGFLQKLFAKIGDKISDEFAFKAEVVVCVIVINLIMLYGFVIVKALLKSVVLDGLFKLKSKKAKEKNGDGTPAEGDGEVDPERKDEPTPDEESGDPPPPPFHHTDDDKKTRKDDDDSLTKLVRLAEGDKEVSFTKRNPILGLFFEGEGYRYAKPWVHRVASVLQIFIYLTEILYFVVFFGLMLGVFYSAPAWLYTVLEFMTAKMYIYPFISLIFLQEVCNTLKAPVLDKNRKKRKQDEEDEKTEKTREARLTELRAELLRRFGKEHCIRFFPTTKGDPTSEYRITNEIYAGALSYIQGEMQRSSGRVVQRYMEGLDALFNNKNISFAASFYSELGEYLIAYTYIRLLAGERQLFIVSDKSRVESLKKYIGKRLTALTGCTDKHTWRVHGYGDQRLDRADVLIACPDDFREDDIVEHYPGFFQECCNAIFVDADRVLSLDSYLCPIMALRLSKVTENRIRFVFLSRDIMQGFGSCLKKFFCLDEVVDYSNLEEHEQVNYYLWNRESKRIYRGKEQRLTSVEGVIAEEAILHDVDGVRILTETPLDHAEKSALLDRNVEINDFYKNVPEVNFLICTDDRYNLSSAVHAFTRFRGKKSSILHILSKPYLLREYFMSHIERYVNRSSFIQPRAIEYAGTRKLSLLRLFCEATAGDGIDQTLFLSRMKDIVIAAGDGSAGTICPFCDRLEERYRKATAEAEANGGDKHAVELTIDEYAAYLVAGLCDGADTPYERSEGKRARDYYIFVIPDKRRSGYRVEHESMIRFTRIREVFAKLLAGSARVELRLNDKQLGTIDTFPSRVYQQYLPGQSLVFNNTEYEIERISDDRSVIYLRQENVTSRNTIECLPLRRYLVTDEKPAGNQGVVTFTRGPIESITLTREYAHLEGDTYGYHSLMTDCQTIDFERGMEGNLNISDETVEKQRRRFDKARVLSVSIKARPIAEKGEDGVCTDGMRMLMAAVFSEFIRTMFPDAYRCIAVCPVLETPLTYARGNEIVSFEDHVRTVYPFLKAESSVMTEQNEVKLLFLNDCSEDVGVLDLLFDYRAMFMQQFLTNVYGYLHWLKKHPVLAGGQKHFIYFGRDELSKVYDLEGCCRLLADCNRIFSDSGKNDVTVVGDEEESEKTRTKKYCSFCHGELERGRYFAFDNSRLICMNCQTTSVSQNKVLEKQFDIAKKYLAETYPDVGMPTDLKAVLDTTYELKPGQEFSEYYYRLAPESRTVRIERDDPELNVAVSLIRGIIGFWQKDNRLDIPHSMAQLYYEELIYLRAKGETVAADWIEEHLSADIKDMMREIDDFVKGKTPAPDEGETPETPVMDAENAPEGGESEADPAPANGRNSFTFLFAEKNRARFFDDPGDIPSDTSDDTLYDPDDIPRFWKRYLRGEQVTGSADDIPKDSEDTADEPEEDTPVEPSGDADGDGEGNVGKKAKKDKPKKDKGEEQPKRHACGMKYLAVEQDEATNPRIALYNALVRRAAEFDDTPIPVKGVLADEVEMIYQLVRCDYPELFWMDTASWSYMGKYATSVSPKYRCLGADGKIDRKQVMDKLKEMRKGAKYFTKGISKRTDPYKALITIYRRLILTLDYDGVGLSGGADRNRHSDDSLRSLYSALVTHKVVCAGYAVALQYLAQKVGLVCAYVISEATSVCRHAFNAVKIGKECFYIDATWGDSSNTETGDQNKNLVTYDYCCVPLRELQITSPPSDKPYHTPNKSYYPTLEEFRTTRYEYYRARGLYFDGYDEDKIRQALMRTVKDYDSKEMGDFTFSFRCSDNRMAAYFVDRLIKKQEIFSMVASLKSMLNKKEAKLFGSGSISYFASPDKPTVTIIFK